ncbi:MAG: PepSY domain-containing protein [Steroidobacteraceae bacterium]
MLGLRKVGTAGGGISIDQAIQIAERQYGSRVVRADVSDVNGRRVYLLRMLSDKGVVRTVKIDAETGGIR